MLVDAIGGLGCVWGSPQLTSEIIPQPCGLWKHTQHFASSRCLHLRQWKYRPSFFFLERSTVAKWEGEGLGTGLSHFPGSLASRHTSHCQSRPQVCVTALSWQPGRAEGHCQALDDLRPPGRPVVSSGKPQIIQFMKPNPVF